MNETMTNADIILSIMKEYGRVTSREMRELGIKRPSATIAKLKKRGLRIRSEIINTKDGREMAIYTLIERKPPRLRLEPWCEISPFWKWRR